MCVCIVPKHSLVVSGVRTSVNTPLARPALPFNIKMPVSLQLLTLFQPPTLQMTTVCTVENIPLLFSIIWPPPELRLLRIDGFVAYLK